MSDDNSHSNNLDPKDGNDPKPSENTGSDNNGDNGEPVKLTSEQWEAAFNSPRFKELTSYKKKYEEMTKKQEEAENERLKEQNKWKEIAEKNEQKAKELEQKMNQQSRQMEISSKAAKLGFIDPSDAYLHIGSDVEDLDEALKKLSEEKSYLVKKDGDGGGGNNSNIGNNTNGNNNSNGKGDDTSGAKKWNWSELKKNASDPKWWEKEENRKEYRAAMNENRIDYNK